MGGCHGFGLFTMAKNIVIINWIRCYDRRIYRNYLIFLVFTKTSPDDDARAGGPGYYFSIFGKLQKCGKKRYIELLALCLQLSFSSSFIVRIWTFLLFWLIFWKVVWYFVTILSYCKDFHAKIFFLGAARLWIAYLCIVCATSLGLGGIWSF